MYFSAVELPQDLVQAHRDGRLVIFVGAGASRADPSNLPDFRSLANDIATSVHAGDLDLDEDPDVLLGRLVEAGIEVNQLVADRLAGGEPNALHRAIVSLAASGSGLRIVTTNYDRHLSTALSQQALEVDEYRAPALPMGDDIEGLVYLHGSLNQSPDRLIVTDRDFGRAYLRDAWAARFLERMYSTYTVLFVGYSVSDVVMRYLARSLSKAQPRFSFTHEPNRDDWRRLGIRPVGYDAEGGDHSHLVDVITEWATEVSRGLLDHRQRVRELVAAPPTGVPDEESYLEATIADGVRARFFTEFADHPEWLSWVQRRPPFPDIFDTGAALQPAAQELASWFVDRFVLDQDRTSSALATVQAAGGGLSPSLWWMLGRRLRQETSLPAWLGPWLVLLVEQATPGRLEWLEYILADAEVPAQRSVAVLLFDHLTQPRGTLEPSVFLPVRLEVSLLGSEHWLREAWDKRLAPALPDLAPDILAIADRHLRRAHQLFAVAASNDQPFDPLHFGRSAIHAHPQDAHQDAFDVLLDAARDSLEAALDAEMALAHGYLDAWLTSRVPLLRRLAVHGGTHRSDVSPTDKLDWVLGHDLLFDDQVRAEVFHLLGQVIGDVDEPTAARLVQGIAAGPDLDEEDVRDRSRFDLLHWLLEARPTLPGAEELLDDLEARHPEWQPDSTPGLMGLVQSGFRQPRPPMTIEELHQQIAEAPATTLAELQHYREVSFSFSGTTWEDVLGLISATVRQHPIDGVQLMAQEGGPEVAAAVVRGWSQAEMPPETADQVLGRLLELPPAGLEYEIADLLAGRPQSEAGPTRWWRLSGARQLALRLWESIDPVEEESHDDDWLGRAINHPAGKLAEFWLQAVANDWQESADAWAGLPPDLTEPLEQLLSTSDIRSALAEPVVASRLRLLHGADPEWAENHVLPLFSWATPDRAVRAWHGYLFWGRPTRQLLEAGLLSYYIEAAREASRLSDEMRRQLARHLAGIATSPAPPPELWVSKFVAAADPDLRVHWAESIRRMLKDLPEEEIAAQWSGWLEPYWVRRQSGVPRGLDLDEASAMAGWSVHLGSAFPAAAELVVAQPANLDRDRDLLRSLADAETLTASEPGVVADLLAHLLSHTAKTLWDCETLREIFVRVLPGASPDSLNTIREHAFRLGCSGAPDW